MGYYNKFLDVLEKVCREKQLDCSTIIYQATPSGDWLLHVAAEYGRTRIAELLVDNNILLIVTNKRKDTALHVAARAKNIGVMKAMLSKFDDASSKDNFIMLPNKVGNIAFHEAIMSKYREGFDFLLSEQSKSTLSFYWDTQPADSPMYVAVQSGDVEILRRLLQIPFPSDRVIYKNHGNSPLHAAISERNIAVLKEIVDKKEELMFLRHENENTPLHYAAYTGYVEGVRELLNKSPLVAFQQNAIASNLPIHVACCAGHVQVVEEFLCVQGPCTSFWLNNEGQNILHIAAMRGRNKMFGAYMILRTAGGASPNENKPRESQPVENKEWNVHDGANPLIIVAVLVATVTFAAGFTVPGGVYSSDDPILKERGMAVLTDQTLFKIFMAFNTISMYCSTIGSVILLWMHMGDRRFSIRAYHISRVFVQWALITMPVAFMAAIRWVVSNNSLIADLTSVIAFIFIFLSICLGVLGYFPMGSPSNLRQVGQLLLWTGIILFYGSNDIGLWNSSKR
ncbi:protein ACCELERATED CELL DEATH 6-like [Prosopis cineraria]|uniref:protein ACCELERATED CELL DEATH 6-like n=1 Tax=Prosopis cineraria TaxID=364024 RepID=UPI00240F2C6D|nr:protein ACCELERATED CELL DEATH 6-like [Prosopis cineraria]